MKRCRWQPQSMADFITTRRAAGITRFQLKVSNRPDDDIARTKACAEAGEGKTVIIADSNEGWNILDAQLALCGIEDLPIYIEQPAAQRKTYTAADPESEAALASPPRCWPWISVE